MLTNLMNEQVYYDENRGFITKKVHGEIPDYAVPVSKEEHARLINEANAGDRELYVENGEVKLRDIKYSSEEIAHGVRQRRDIMLRGCDWSQLPDVDEKVRAKYAAYRKALRDIPNQKGFPFDVVWPTVE